ncbi:hypothetical protein SAV14893_072500 [Streptomyces avermitilis]|uniref:Uncharacterized protein n=1 Tax=Streptomyces avermitilis TaxID=33903 RepID=A0A4D4M8I0_STRAX|nr:hypothetical protein SAV14893_072500 [Streptomyces avermitilis]
MRVLMPVPDRDFDVTEVAVPWRLLTDAGHEVVLATERAGTRPAADPRLLTGVLFGQLGAEDEPKRCYEQLTAAPSSTRPSAGRTSTSRSTTVCCCPAVTPPGCASTSAPRNCGRRSPVSGP